MKRLTLLMLALAGLVLLQGCVSNNKRGEDPAKAASIYADLGLEYLRQGKLDLALDKLERSLELDNKHPAANHYIAEVYKQMNKMDLADKYYAKAVNYDANNPMLLNNYGAFLCQQKRFKESEDYFVRAANAPRYRTPELAYENLAICALQMDDKEKAESYFRQALSIQPVLPKSLYQMASLSYDKQEHFKARAFIERFHALGETEQSLMLGIKIEEALGDTAAAARYRERLTKNFPQAQPQ